MRISDLRSAMVLLAALSLLSYTGSAWPAPTGASSASANEQAREDVRTTARKTLQMLYAKQPGAKRAIEKAAGYAVFSSFSSKILLVGGGMGKGMAVNNHTGQQIFMRMAEVQAGLGFGVKKLRLVWVFETQGAFNQFVNSGYEFGGQATLAAKAGNEGGEFAGAASISPGVWVYQLTDAGLAVDLTVKGTKYYRDKDLNATDPN